MTTMKRLRGFLRPAGYANSRPPRHAGQALVEFAVAIIPFLMLLMAVVDLGRGIYMLNGTSEAARDIARVTSVHQWNASGDLGSSPQAAAVIATQRGLIPSLTINPSVDIVCVDYLDQVLADTSCQSGKATDGIPNFIRVHLTAPFVPMTPLVSAFGSHTFDSTSRIQVP
jgi:Flp pilus assembly protein TadG